MDLAQIEAIMDVLRDSRLTELEVRQGDVSLRLRRASVPAPQARSGAHAAAAPASPTEPAAVTTMGEEPGTIAVTAGLVGVFHQLRDPIQVGSVVAERQVLGQIESMRLMNDCLAPIAGRIVSVRVEEEQPVEYGQTLFEIVSEGE